MNPAPLVTSVTAIDPSPTNLNSISYAVTFSEAVTGVDSGDFSLNVVNLTSPMITGVNGSAGSYTVTVNTGSGDGSLRLDVIDDDSILNVMNEPLGGPGAGNGNFTTGDVVVVDRTAPGVMLSTDASTTVLEAFSVSVQFSESVTGFDVGDVTVVNGVVTGLTGSGSSYGFTVIPNVSGDVSVSVAAGKAVDAAGNGNTASNLLVRDYLASSPERRIATTTTGDQETAFFGDRGRTVAVSPVGAVVVWSGNGPGDTLGIFAQRFNTAGAALGTEVLVNTYTTASQITPAVAVDANGDALVVWVSVGQDGSQAGIYGQRLSAAGTPIGGEFRVNTFTLNNQSRPAVAVDADGDAIVVWSSFGPDGSGAGIFAQRYNSSGSPVGGEFRVNSTTLDTQTFPCVAMDGDGDAVVAWQSYDGAQYDIFAQRYDAAGSKVGGEFLVNTTTTLDQRLPAVAMDSAGNFAVTWSGEGPGDAAGVFLQRFSAAGAKVGSETRANTFTTGAQSYSTVALDADGDAIVLWHGNSQDTGYGVFGQRYAAAGTPVGGEFQVNSYTTGDQAYPSVAVNADGDAIAVWTSFGQDGSGAGVYGRWIPDTVAPTVASIAVNDGAVQRSRVLSITVTFSEPVTVGANTFQLQRTGPGGPMTTVTLAVDLSASTPTQTVARLTFSGALTESLSLIDGLYTLTVAGAEFVDLAGNAGTTATSDFHRLFGDADGNRIVDASDFLAFRLAFLGSSATFDADNNGSVDASDFLRFRLQFLKTI